MKRFFGCVAALAAVLFASGVQAQELPPDLAAVPGTALGFVHVRVAEVWKGEALKDVRDLVEKAGPSYRKMVDERFVPAPSSIDRVTLIVTIDRQRMEPLPLVVITTSEAFDRDKLVKESLVGAKEMKAGEATYYYVPQRDVAVQIAGDRMLIVGPDAALKEYLSRSEKGHGPFDAVLKEAAGKCPITLALNTAVLPPDMLAQLPPPLQPLLKHCLVQISLEPGNSPVIDLKQHYANATAADDAEKAMKDALVTVKQMLAMHRKEAEASLMGKSDGNRSTLEEIPEAAAALAALGLINKAEEILKDFPTKREGNALATRVTIPEGPVGRAVSTMGLAAGFLLPAVQKVREAAARTQSQNNLKQLNLAVINYETTFNALPPAAICDKQGKPLLSWRVAVLPYVEQSALYREFHLDEPWDSEHNIKLIHKFPRVFANPLVPLTGREEYPTTNYLALVGNGAGWELKGGLKFPASFPDGTSNTIWLVEAEKGVPWTKPEDISYDPKKMPPLGFFAGGRCNVGFADGSVRALSRQVPERTWHLLIQRNDGEPIPAEDLDK